MQFNSRSVADFYQINYSCLMLTARYDRVVGDGVANCTRRTSFSAKVLTTVQLKLNISQHSSTCPPSLVVKRLPAYIVTLFHPEYHPLVCQ